MSTKVKEQEDQSVNDFDNNAPNWPVLLPILLVIVALVAIAFIF